MKEARVSWNRPRNQWIIRFWSQVAKDWIEDSAYLVTDVDPETEIGYVSENLITRLYDLQQLGYTIYFCD